MAQSRIFNAYYQEEFIGEVSAPDAEAAMAFLIHEHVTTQCEALGVDMDSDDGQAMMQEFADELINNDQFRVVTVK